VGLVDDDVVPRELAEGRALDAERLEGGDDDVVAAAEELLADEPEALLLGVGGELEDLEGGAPLGELAVPVAEGRLGREDEVRACEERGGGGGGGGREWTGERGGAARAGC
jgi:hypothetical protein